MLLKKNAIRKTDLWTYWMLTSTCKYKSKCYFAHGINELQKRVRVPNYKTRPCADCHPIVVSACSDHATITVIQARRSVVI